MISNNQFMAYLLAFKNVLMYHSLEVKIEWNKFIEDLSYRIDRGEHIYSNKLGLIDNWMEYTRITLVEDV